MQTRREATREATIREIKQTALARMRAEGTVDVRLSDVARDMRMSAPGLYRYFDGREGLLTALIIDALTDLAVQIEKARDSVPAGDAGGRFLAVARAYRTWALTDPQGFTLVFGPPLTGVPRGHQESADDPGKAAALRAMEGLRSLIREAEEAGTRQPARCRVPPVLAEAFADTVLHGADPATEVAMVHTWAALHGLSRWRRTATSAGTGRRCRSRSSSAWSGCSPRRWACPSPSPAGPTAPPCRHPPSAPRSDELSLRLRSGLAGAGGGTDGPKQNPGDMTTSWSEAFRGVR